MDISQLETFLAVIEERGFSRAALRLRRTQPAVSHTIRRLEDEIGEVLFERASREGTLSAAGDLLREYAERLLKLRGVEQIEKVLIDRDPARREEMMTRTGRRTVPQIYIGDTHVGGYDDLSKLDREGGLVPLLQAA
jgi:glutaredoxin 3